MNKIGMIELFISDWKAAEEQDKALGREKQEQYAKGRKDGLASALDIFTKPSNTQMQIDAPTIRCSGCGAILTDPLCIDCFELPSHD